ncbi:MAG: LPS assembly protein LptD [Steroidobacteraceae bacterium]
MTGEMIAPPRCAALLSLVLLSPVLATALQAATPACTTLLPTDSAAGGAAPLPATAALLTPPALPALPSLTDGIRFSADGPDAFLDTDADGNFDLGGEVTFSVGARELRGRHLRYNAATDDYRLTGAVSYTDRNLHLQGDAGNYAAGNAAFTHAQFEMLQHPGRGQADTIAMRGPDLIELRNVMYTTCPPGKADWELRAQRITLDTRSLRGVGRGTRVKFKGVTLVYLPWISFPLSSARQSGFLFPTFGSSGTSGATLAVPWYWNIAPNQDLTLTPRIMTRRGVELGSEYRLLQPSYSGTLMLNYLPDDHNYRPVDKLERKDRAWERVKMSAQLPQEWRALLHAENVSDSHYFEDFGNGPQATSTTFLRRDLQLGFRDDIWRLGAQVLQFQTLLPGCPLPPDPASGACLTQQDRPYAQLPRLTASARWLGSAGIGSFLDSELVDFQRRDSVRGWRAHVQPGMSFAFVRPGYYFRPSAGWDLTSYRLNAYQLADGSAGDVSPNRSLPVITLDTALRLERRSGRGATRLITLEPRLYYVYVPFRDQRGLPLFDSGLPDPNLVSLLRANRFVGLDRIGDANDLTLGLTARLLQADSGRRFLSATIGQTTHFSQPRVTLLDESLDTRRRSDLIAALELTAYRNWNLRYDVAWNPTLAQTEKSQLSLQYRPPNPPGAASDRVVNLGYRYTRGNAEQTDVSVAWPVARRWDLYGRNVYSFRDQRSIDSFAGFQFRGNCWGLRLVARNSVSNRDGSRDTGWYLQLELKGLSSVGSGADSFLQGAIQGYSPTTTNR